MLSTLFNSAATINPNAFGDARAQKYAAKAAEQDQAHTQRIKGTNNADEIKGSFKESQNSWKNEMKRDKYVPSGGKQAMAPDGGMRELAKSLGRLRATA